MKLLLQSISLLLFLSTYSFANTIAINDDLTLLKKLVGKWRGSLEWSIDAKPEMLNLEYSIRSNGSALLEESNQGGVEMLTIFNDQNGTLQSTHYCGLMNKPIAYLKSNKNNELVFETDVQKSGLNKEEEAFVLSWKIGFIKGDENHFNYEYKVLNPDGSIVTRTALMEKVN
jgi:hypothetical protein